MYKFLVTNDDGIESTGLKAVVKSLSRLGMVYVVAPAHQQSAKSMSLTFATPVTPQESELDGAEICHIIDGTPCDCVKWCIDRYKGMVDFDYVISGINLGYNLGTDQYYSGTVAAAREGALQGIHSIALSVEGHHSTNFEYICGMLSELLEMSRKLDGHTLLNVNTPDLPAWKVKGVKIVPGAPHEYGDIYHFSANEDGTYQMGVSYSEMDEKLENDFNAIAAGYATITPITAAIEDRAALRRLQGIAVEEPIFIFLDSQEELVEGLDDGGRWKNNITRWARCIDRLDMPALVAEQHGRGKTIKGIRKALDRIELVDRLEFNAMDNPDFTALLETGLSKRVYIAGLETHISVQMTGLELAARGYDVVIIEDCCAASSAENHRIAIENLRAAGCRLASFESAIMELLGGPKHQAFKSINAIISECEKR